MSKCRRSSNPVESTLLQLGVAIGNEDPNSSRSAAEDSAPANPLAGAEASQRADERQRKIEILGTALTLGIPLVNTTKNVVNTAIHDGSAQMIVDAICRGLGLQFAIVESLQELSELEQVDEARLRAIAVAIELAVTLGLSRIPAECRAVFAADPSNLDQLLQIARSPFSPRFTHEFLTVFDRFTLACAATASAPNRTRRM